MSYTQNFDGSGSPPTGWTWDAAYSVTSTPGGGISPVSSPNVLALAATGTATAKYGTYGTQDADGGNCTVSCWFNAVNTTNAQFFEVYARGNTSDLSLAGKCYKARLDTGSNILQLIRLVSGSPTTLTSVSVSLSVPEWYNVAINPVGTSTTAITVQVQRNSDSKYLTSSDTWQAAQVYAISYTDTTNTVTGSGYTGIAIASKSDNAYADNFSLNDAAPTVVYFADAGSGGESSVSSGLAGEAGSGAEGSAVALHPIESGSSGDVGLASPLSAEAGSGLSASILTALTSSFVYVDDGGTDVEGSILARLGAEGSAEADAFLATFVQAEADLGGEGEGWLAALQATFSASAVDPAFSSESAPAPTQWAADLIPAVESWLASRLGPDSALHGTTDLGFESEAWTVSTAIIGTESAGSVDSGTGQEAGYSWVVITYAGYHVYENTGAGDPINFTAYVAEIVGLNNVTWTTPRLSPGTWSFDVRAFSPYGEEQNVDVAVTIVINAAGADVSNIPDPPRAIAAVAQAGGVIAVQWAYPAVSGPSAPTGFHVYQGTGGVANYSTPVATVKATSGLAMGRYSAAISGLVDRVAYTFGVRAYNGTGEETNTLTATATARVAGPNAVQSLTITADS